MNTPPGTGDTGTGGTGPTGPPPTGDGPTGDGPTGDGRYTPTTEQQHPTGDSVTGWPSISTDTEPPCPPPGGTPTRTPPPTATRAGHRLTHLREAAGFTRDQLATRVDVPTAWLAKAETGRAAITAHGLLARLAHHLNCGARTLLAADDTDTPPPTGATRRGGTPPDATPAVADLVITADLALPTDPTEAITAPEARRALDRTADAWRAGRLTAVAARLPSLLHALTADPTPDTHTHRTRAYLAAARLLAARGHLAAAHLATRHAATPAPRHTPPSATDTIPGTLPALDPDGPPPIPGIGAPHTAPPTTAADTVNRAAARLATAHLLADDGLLAEADYLADDTLAALPTSPTTTPAVLCLRGDAHLLRGILAAAAGRPELSRSHLDEADADATRLGDTPDHYFTLFSTAAVGVARMAAAVEAGDIGHALTLTRRLDPADIAHPAMRARYWCEAARVAVAAGRHTAALDAVEHADAAAPDVARTDPMTRHILDYLTVRDTLGYRGRLTALTTEFRT